MSMLTRCPECGTSFRITTDQLVSRQGKVRCGHCKHVFSALGTLVHTRDDPAHPPSGSSMPLDGNSQLTPLDRGSQLTPLDRGSQLTPLDRGSQLTPLGGNSRFSPLEANSRSMPLDANSQSMPLDTPSRPAEYDGPASFEEIDITNTGPPVARPLKELERAEEEEDEEEQDGRRRVAWLSLAGVLLALVALAGQGAYFYRDQLALLQPETKPWLALMCVKLSCKIETPLDPQAISIETSSLEADPADRNLLQLTALLRNRSVLPQNLPYLELTLLDAQEAPQARRVIRPDEYGQRAVAGQPQLAAESEYQVRLSIDASALKASGYRLYAFYP
jgi:predicted Zn finger-like uncharacterized protein